jgi:hypothetical protein
MKDSSLSRVVLFLVVLLTARSPVEAFDGPLEAANPFPLYTHLNAPALESPAVRDAVGVNLTYSSNYFRHGSTHWSAWMDLETLTVQFRLKKRFGSRLELGLDLPFLSFNSGFMDGFLNWYHGAFGLPDYGRSRAPANRFTYTINKGGRTVVEGQPGQLGLGDIRLSGKYALLDSSHFLALSLKTDLELPTGDPEKGYGSGGLDWGLALLFEKAIAPCLSAFANVGVVFPGPWKAMQDIDLNTYYHGGLGLEWSITKTMTALTQAWIQTSPLPQTGISSLDRPAVLWAIGGRYHFTKTFLELSFTEDPNTAGAPDFSIQLNLKRKF